MNKKVNHQHLLWTALTPAGTNLTRWAVTLAVVMTCLFATTTEAWAQESGEEPQTRILTLGSGWNANGATVAASYLMGDETVEYTSAEFSQEPAPVPEGSTVTLTITPGEGYLVDKVSVTKYEEPEIVGGIESRTRGTDGEASVEVSHAAGTNVWSFTMPAYDVEVTVAYKKAPEIQTETVTNPDGTETTTETIKETVTNPDGTETTTETIKETVTDKDGKVIQTKETIKETVTDKDGKVIQTKETIKKKVTNPDGTETTTENTKETVTNPDGTETTTEAITTTTTGADGSQTITTSKTPDLDVAIGPVKIDNDDNTNWHKIPTLKVVISDNPDHVKLLIEQGHESNVLINSVTEKDAQGEVTASSVSLTVKQNGSVDDGPTKIAINTGGGVNLNAPTSGKCGRYMTWVVSANAGSSVYDVLTISGSGQMDDMIGGSPWDAYQNQIKTVIIGERVTSIGIRAFSDCSAMTSLTFAEGSQLQTIGDYAFYGLTSLTSDIILPASVTSMGQGAFARVSKNTTVGISITAAEGSRLTAIHTDAFSYANASIDLSNCTLLEAIGSDLVFSQVTGDVTLPSSVTRICQYAFENEYSQPYPGKHVYITVPDGKKLKVTIAGETDPVEVTPTNGKADIIGCLFANRAERIASRALTLKIVDASTGGEGGGDNGGGSENPDAPTSGTFGNFTWTVSKSNASSRVYDVLTISGEGKMETGNGTPWGDYITQIKTVIINKPVTSSPASVTSNDEGVLSIGEGVTIIIGENVFAGFTGDHVYVTMPEGKILSVILDMYKSPEIIKPTDGKVDIIDYLFANPSNRTSSRPLPLVVDDNIYHLALDDEFTVVIGAGEKVSETVNIPYKCYHFCGKDGKVLFSKAEMKALNIDVKDKEYIGMTVDAMLTAERKQGQENKEGEQITTYVVKENKATKLTLLGIPSNIANFDTYFYRPQNISFEGADIDIENIYSKGVNLAIGDRINLVVPFGDKVGRINGSRSEDGKYNYHAFLKGSSEDSVLMLEIDFKNSNNDQGQEPSTREKNDRAAKTMIVNYETKKETTKGNTVTVHDGDVGSIFYGGKSKDKSDNNTVNFPGGTVDHIIGSGSRAAAAEQEDDEIEIVSGREYEILHDGYVVLNFYTPDADITVNSIVFRRPGDANNDGYVNAVDLVEMINAKNGHASERFNLANADIDRDGTITQADIDAVVKMIME